MKSWRRSRFSSAAPLFALFLLPQEKFPLFGILPPLPALGLAVPGPLLPLASQRLLGLRAHPGVRCGSSRLPPGPLRVLPVRAWRQCVRLRPAELQLAPSPLKPLVNLGVGGLGAKGFTVIFLLIL